MKNHARGILIALVTAIATLTGGLTMSAQAAPASTFVAVSAPLLRSEVSPSVRAEKPRRLGSVSAAFDTHWWGISHNFGPAGTQRIIYYLTTAGGIVSIAGALCAGTIVGVPCGMALAVAGGLAAIGSGWISWCSRNGDDGFRFVKAWVGSPYCNPR